MKPEVKAAWLEALRSGRYIQGCGALRSVDNYFCCLGVLCDISGIGEWIPTGGGFDFSFRVDRYQARGLPPRLVYEWAGLEAEKATKVARMNDGEVELGENNERGVASFAEIADYIEANF